MGSALSNIGSWFQMIAQALLILQLTHDGSALGVALAVQSLPMLLIGPFTGPFLDRADLRRLILIISVISGLQAMTLGILVLAHTINLASIYLLSLFIGVVQVCLTPANQALIPQLVAKDAIPSAVSYASIQQTVGRLAGPAAAALVFAWKGAAACYFVNALSYVVVFIAVLSLRVDTSHRRGPGRARRQYRDSIAFVWSRPEIRTPLLANVTIGLFCFNFQLFFTAFTQLVLHAGAFALGVAESTNALFAMLGGLYLAHRKIKPSATTYILGCAGLGLSLVLLAVAPNVIWFLVAMAIFGLGVSFYQIVSQTTLQLNTPPERMGSVMVLFSFGTRGTTPVGALLMGWIISATSARAGLGLAGIAAVATAVVLAASSFRRVRGRQVH